MTFTQRTAHDWRSPSTQLTAEAALAKSGAKLRASMNTSASTGDLMHDRNELRRVVNATKEHAEAAIGRGDTKAADGALDEMHALSAFLSRTQSLLDNALIGAERNRGGAVDGITAPILRNAADVAEHFGKRASNAEPVGAGDFLRAVAGMKTRSGTPQAALSEGTDSAGGYNVPQRVLTEILQALVPASSLLQAGAGIMPLDLGAKSYTMAAVNALPTAAWRNEAGAIAESDPTFRAVVATPRSLAFRFKLSRELLADADGLDRALIQVIAMAFAKELDRAGLRGTGSAPEPRGILNTVGIQSVTNGANGTAQATLKWQNLLDATKAILAADGPMPTAAIMAPRTLTGFGGLADSTGQPLQRPGMLEGVKFVATSQVPINLTVGTSTDCTELYVGDFSSVLFAMREAVSIQRLGELYAETGQIGFVGHVRADVMCQYPATLAVATGIRA